MTKSDLQRFLRPFADDIVIVIKTKVASFQPIESMGYSPQTGARVAVVFLETGAVK